MKWKLLPRYLLLTIWGSLAIFFLFNAVFIFCNYFFAWRPDKISVYLPFTLMLSGYSLLFGLIGVVLFVGLVRCRCWLFNAYWVSLFITILWMLTAIHPSIKDIPSILGLCSVMAIIGVFIYRKRKWFGFEAATNKCSSGRGGTGG